MYYSVLVLGATNLGTYSTAKERLHRWWGLAGVTLTFSSSLAAGLAIAITTAQHAKHTHKHGVLLSRWPLNPPSLIAS